MHLTHEHDVLTAGNGDGACPAAHHTVMADIGSSALYLHQLQSVR